MGAQKRKHRSKGNKHRDSTDGAPPTKKQRTDHTNKRSSNGTKSKKRGTIRMFLQLANFTEQQISNILNNTKKGVDRPLVLFTDNDQDQFFLRVTSIEGKIKVNERKFSDDLLDINGKLLHKYEDWFADNYLSFGIITDFKEKEMYQDEDKFRVNVDSNFKTLRNVVDTLKIKEIIVPYHYANRKRKADHEYIFWGPNLSKHHLQYIQGKFNEFKALYNIKHAQLLFTEHAVEYGDDVEINHIDLFNDVRKRRETQLWLQKLHENETKTKEKKKTAEKQQESKPSANLQQKDTDEEKVPNLPQLAPQDTAGPIIHSLRDQKAAIDRRHDERQKNEYTQLLMQRIAQQNAVILHQQNELRMAKQMMNEYGVQRMIKRGEKRGHQRWNRVYFISTCLSICCVLCVFGLIATSRVNWNIFQHLQIDNSLKETVTSILESIWFIISFVICYYVFVRNRTHTVSNYMNINHVYPHSKRSGSTVWMYNVCAVLITTTAIGAAFASWQHLQSVVSPIAHIIDMEYDVLTISTNAHTPPQYARDPHYAWYICAAFAWFVTMAVLSPKISRNPWQAFFVMSLGPPLMFFSMYLASRMVLGMFYDDLRDRDMISHEERLAILWWFICVCLVPIAVMAVCIGHIIEIASKSPFESIVNWKSFGHLLLSMVVVYAMLNHFDLTVYAFVVFGILYMIVQCFVVSRVDNGNKKRANDANNVAMDGHRGANTNYAFLAPYADRLRYPFYK